MEEKSKQEALKRFEIYAGGVERLKHLEHELNSLSTKKYKKQELRIRKKLKDVSLIPEIEKDIQKLRMKIAGVEPEVEISELGEIKKSEIEAIGKAEKKVETEVLDINKKIELLENQIKAADMLRGKKALSKEEKKLIDDSIRNRARSNFLKNILRIQAQQFGEESRVREKILGERVSLMGITNKSQDEKIGFLRREAEEIQNILPSIIERIDSTEGKIKRIRSLAGKKQLTKNEVADVEKLPELKRELTLLRDKFENLKKALANIELKQFSDKERMDVDKIPGIQRKSNFLNRLFKKESGEILEIDSKVDKNRLDLDKKLRIEIAESRRMIEEEKFELKKQLMDLLRESVFNLKKESEESDRKIMQQIESINKRIELDRKEIDKELISDVLELKARINENKKSLELPKKEELKPLPLKVEKPSPVSMPSSEVLKEDDIERQKRMMDIINESFSLPKLYDNKVREEILSMPELDFSLAQVNVELEKEKKEKSEKIPTSVKLRKKIPAKAFLNLDDFDFLLNEIVQLKMALSSDYHEISHELLKKEHLDRELLSIDQNLGVIKETFSKINSNFPFRGKQ